MTLDEAKAKIASEVAQNAVNVLIDALARAQVEKEELAAKLAALEKKPE